MINQLHISALGVIAEATLDLHPQLTVVTGETGAGKTMIITGLGLLRGQRSDPGAVRHGAERAQIEGRIELDERLAVRDRLLGELDELGADLDDGELLVRRQIAAGGRSRCWLAGVGVPVGRCAEIAEELIIIHGQSDQLRLADADRQRELLDRAAGPDLVELLDRFGERWQRRQGVAADLTELREQAQARAREIDMLRFSLTEIAQVDPQPGEDVDLAAESARLQSVDELRLDAHTALAALSGDAEEPGSGAVSALSTAEHHVAALAARDPGAAELLDGLRQAQILAGETSAELARYLDRLEADPARLEQIMVRRSALAGLLRKYGSDVDEVLAHAAAGAERLETLVTSDDRIEGLAAEHDRLTADLDELAVGITAHRARAADRVAEEVAVELAALAMPKARLEFRLTPLAELGRHGADRVELLFAANPGAEPRPIGRVASGGELSRIRLAVEVVLTADTDGRTVVFDEVDAGIGGAVAVEVGRRLARLAQRCQVVVVTHLAQVAAFADRHLVVTKTDDGVITTSGVIAVDDADRATELSRMMSGIGDTAASLNHARELLATARAGRGDEPPPGR